MLALLLELPEPVPGVRKGRLPDAVEALPPPVARPFHRSLAAVLLFAGAQLLLAGCAGTGGGAGTDADADAALAARLDALLPADAVLLGEQHDAPEHQRIGREAVALLAGRGELAALVLEMAPQGGSTAGLPRGAEESHVREALRWSERAWPWRSYGPAVMAAVRAGVPVLGGNLPSERLHAVMADAALDARLPAEALIAQQEAIRAGHCGLLPQDRLRPMARAQIARDLALAHTLQQAAVPGRTVLLLAGAGHVDRALGVPRHLPPGFKVKVVEVQARRTSGAVESIVQADALWSTPTLPPRDYCAGLRRALPPAPAASAQP